MYFVLKSLEFEIIDNSVSSPTVRFFTKPRSSQRPAVIGTLGGYSLTLFLILRSL